MQILIDQGFAKIGINKTPAQFNINKTNGNLNLQVQPVSVTMHSTSPKVVIDNAPVREDLGFKNSVAFSQSNASQGMQDVFNGISRRVKEGNAMAAIENKTPVIANIARSNMEMYDVKDFYFDMIPHAKPVINYIPGELQINVIPRQSVNNTEPPKVSADYTPSQLNFYLLQKPYLNISFVEKSKIDLKA